MANEWKAVCKDCGSEFGYSDNFYQAGRARGMSRPERCSKCRIQHSKEIGILGLSHYELRPVRQIDPSRGLRPGFLGALSHPPRVHELEEISQAYDLSKFTITDEGIRRLFSLMRRHQVTVVVGPTGSGKSTFLPYRLMVPPPGEASDTFTRHGQIVVTQPRIAATTSIPKFVAGELYGANLGVGYDVGFRYSGERATDWRNKLAYITDGTLINWIVSDQLGKLSVIVIDEAHERSLNIDLILGLLKARLPRHPSLKLIVASATIDAEKFVSYYADIPKELIVEETAAGRSLTEIADSHGVGYIEFEGKEPSWLLEVKVKPPPDRYGGLRYETRFREGEPIAMNQWPAQMSSLMAKKVCEILQAIERGDEVQGDILGFLHGKRPIEDACRRIREFIEEDENLVGKVDVFPLYAELGQSEQRAAYGPKKNPGQRRIVISTNVAETSLTVEGIVHVVDSGLINETRWDPAIQTTTVMPTVHSQAGCRQRWGRSGRIRHGLVHCLYTDQQFVNEFPPYTVPEIRRAPLEQVVLTAKAAGVDDIINFDWIEKPSLEELKRSSWSLSRRGALDKESDLTEHGLELHGFTDHPDIANLMVLADRMACAVEMATLLAMTKAGGRQALLRWNRDWDATTKRHVNRIHQGLVSPCQDDVEFYQKLYEAWAGDPQDKEHKASDWAKANYVSHGVFERKVQVERDKLLRPLTGHKKSEKLRRINFDLLTRLRMVLVYGLPDRVYILETDGNATTSGTGTFSYRPFLANQDEPLDADSPTPAGAVEINPDSVCHGKMVEAFVCLQKRLVRRRISPLSDPEQIVYASCLTLVKPEWLSCIGTSTITLARAIANETREASGELRLTADRARLFLDQFYQIGSTFSCRLLETLEGAAHQLVLLGERLSAAAPVIEVTRDEEAEEPTDVEDEPSAEVLPGADHTEAGPTVETIDLHEEDERLWSSLTEEAAEDVVDSAASDRRAALTDDAGGRVQAIARLRLRGRQAPAEESFSVIVEDIDFTDFLHPAVEVRLPHEKNPFSAFTEKYKVGDEINVTVRSVEKYPNDYLTYLLVEHEDTGLEIMMEPEDVSLVGRNFAVEMLTPGDTFDCVVEQINVERERVRITRLKEAEEELLWFRSRDTESTVEGLIAEVAFNGVYVLLEPDNEQLKVPMGAFALSVSLPSKTELTMLGNRCRVKIRFNEKKVWRRQLLEIPDALPDLLKRGGFAGRITFDDEKQTLTVAGRMTYENRLKLLSLSNHTSYHRAVNFIYRRSNGLNAEIIDVDSLNTLAEVRQQDGRIKAKIVRIEPYGVFVKSNSGIQGLVHASEIRTPDRQRLNLGEEVEVLVKNVNVDKAQVEFSLRLPEDDPWLSYEIGDEVVGSVTGLQDYGAFVELEPGIKGLIHVTGAAWTRVNRIENVVSVGDEITALIVKKDDTKKTLALSLRLDSNNPESLYPVGSWHYATVVDVQDSGAYVELSRGAVGRLPIREIGYNQINQPGEVLSLYQQLRVRMLKIEFRDNYYELSVSLKDPAESPYRQYHPGMKLHGSVCNIRDSGVVVQLDLGGRAFIPNTELSWSPFHRPHEVVSLGESLAGTIITVDADAETLVLSKKDIETDPFLQYEVGMELEGEVTGIRQYGAFIEIAPGISGLVHRNDLSWTRPNRVEDVVEVGERLTVRVISKDDCKRELGLSLRSESDRPAARYPIGSWHEGTVVSVQNYGIFIALSRGIVGFTHISEMSFNRLNHPSEVVSKGKVVRTRVLNVIPKEEFYEIGLSLKDPSKHPYHQYTKGTVLAGRVYAVENFGALIDLERGGVGLVPTKELSWEHVSHPADVVDVGERVTAQVVSIDLPKNELILSKRALEEHPFTRYRPGMRLHGVVARVLDYGAFVEIANGGTGLVPIAEMSWEYVNHPSDVVREGDQVTVEVLSVDLSANRLSLSMRLPERHWINNYQTNSVVEGTVESIQDRGAVIRLQRGGTGWLHISELAWRRVNYPGEVVWEGQHIRVLVKSVDGNRKKIELSMKALQAKPVLKVGEIVWGRVSKIEQFGAFVDLGEYGSGLIHISQLSYGYVKHPSEIVKEGDSVPVLVMETSPKIKLSLKQAQ